MKPIIIKSKLDYLNKVWTLKPQIDEIASKFIYPYNDEFNLLESYLKDGNIEKINYLIETLVYDSDSNAYSELISLNFSEILKLCNLDIKSILNLPSNKPLKKIITLDEIRARAKSKRENNHIVPLKVEDAPEVKKEAVAVPKPQPVVQQNINPNQRVRVTSDL